MGNPAGQNPERFQTLAPGHHGLYLFCAGLQRCLSLLDGPVPSTNHPVKQDGGHDHEEPTLARVQPKHDLGIAAQTRSQSIGEGDPQGREGRIPTHDDEQPGPQRTLHLSRDRMLDSGPENDNPPMVRSGICQADTDRDSLLSMGLCEEKPRDRGTVSPTSR